MGQAVPRTILRYVLQLALLASLVATLSTGAARAANLSFLQGSAMDAFNEDDVRLLAEAFGAVVADEKTPATRTWKNEATGNHGELQTLVAFAGPKGERCKRLRVTNHARKTEGKSHYTVCEMPEGWLLVPSDYAPAPKQKQK